VVKKREERRHKNKGEKDIKQAGGKRKPRTIKEKSKPIISQLLCKKTGGRGTKKDWSKHCALSLSADMGRKMS